MFAHYPRWSVFDKQVSSRRPRSAATATDRLRKQLRPEMQTFAPAGNAEGKRYTPFRHTCEELRRLLERVGPMIVREAVDRPRGR